MSNVFTGIALLALLAAIYCLARAIIALIKKESAGGFAKKMFAALAIVVVSSVGLTMVQTPEEKAAVKAAKKETKAAQKPATKLKTVKLNMVFQSPWGSEITPEQVALKVPKEATDVYVKIDENKIYWVGKNGETGAVDIW